MQVASIRTLHRAAMDHADLAYDAKRRGEGDIAREHFCDAFRLERQAAEMANAVPNSEPSRSILYRSAATLGIQAEQFEAAAELVRRALEGAVPIELIQELESIANQLTTLGYPISPQFASMTGSVSTELEAEVRIRGFRVELSEVEATLIQHPDVHNAVVVARDEAAGGKRLVAYIVSSARPVITSQIREWLGQHLPEYMIPSSFVELRELPLTLDGKINQRALPDDAESYVAPRIPLEENIARIWEELLKVNRVGIDDNFFDLGGNSLLATQLISRINSQFQLNIPLKSLFEAPSVAGLSKIIEAKKSGVSKFRSRYIPVSVVREVRLGARDRCCLRGHLILEEELNRAAESDTLHLHHIIHFSDEGANTEDNLMLVCPSCHAEIHAQPARYPIEVLREAKRHWIRMRELVPPELVFERENDGYRGQPDLTINFRVESFNLQFAVRAPSGISCGDLGRFIGNWILRPLVFYTRTAPFPSVLTKAHIGPVSLASKAHPEVIFSVGALLGEVPQIEEMELISLVDLRMVAAMKAPPGKPPITQTVTLRWGATPRDLDLHFVHRSSSEAGHVWYKNRGTLDSYPWAELSDDIRHGYGPEVLSFGLLAKGVYTVAVHNFSNETPIAGCGALIEVAIGDTVRRFRCPDQGEGCWWVVFEIDVEAHQMKELNQIVAAVDWNANLRF